MRASFGYLTALAMAAGLTTTAGAALSSNLIQGGTFEGAGFNGVNTTGEALAPIIKSQDSPRTQPELDAALNPVRAWQFHPGGVAAETAGGVNSGESFTDLGKWVGTWGIGTVPNVRSPEIIPAPSHNRSIVTRNGQPTGIMEGTGFRMGVGQFVAAPGNMVAGQAQLDFDYFFRYWEGGTGSSSDIAKLGSTPQILQLEVWGLTSGELPTYLNRYNPSGGNSQSRLAMVDAGWDPLYFSPNFNSQQHSRYLTDTALDAPFVPGAAIGTPDDQVWKTLSDGVYELSGSASNPGPSTYMDGSFQIAQTYDYFYVFAYLVTYSESHPYFWLYGGKPTDTMSVAIDNVSLQVSVQNARTPFNPGDMNLDGLVNVQDINPFVTALGSETAYKAYILGRLTTLGIDTGEVNAVYGEVDPNQSGVINVQDINTFVAMLAGGGVDAAQLAVIPEPASLTLLALGGLALIRRR